MLKGTLEGCILKVIQSKETYGYEISQKLQQYGFSDISEGTIYPLLLRLEKNRYILAQYRDSAYGPKRKYFTITELGDKELQSFQENWLALEQAVDQLFRQEGLNHD
jgi:PadR family transcriptional regulator PadR